SGNLPGVFGSQPLESLIKSLIAASEENIARIDSQIRDLQCMRDREYGVVASLKLVLCPIRKLPDELLAMIMRLALENDSRRIDAATMVLSALRLSQVCKHWRQLAHRTPHLWTTQLPVQYKEPDGYSPDYIAATKVYLERAASRWKSFHNSGPPAILDALAKLAPNSLKLLEEVTLWDVAPVTSAFLCAPRLRKVNLHIYTHTSTPLPMPWGQLTALDVSTVGFSICLDILRQCTNVVRATLYGDRPQVEPTPSASEYAPVTLPFLEELYISIYVDRLASCFGQLSLPKLRKLTINFTDLMDSGDWSPAHSAVFTQFQLRSPNIEDLSLAIRRIDPSQLRELLSHAPRMTDLNLDCCVNSIDDDIFKHLEYAEENMVHLTPQLQKLKLVSVGDWFREDTLLAMIKSRWWTAEELQALPVPPPVARLEHVSI
ncbi:F-box domain-containing protein, partial [Favolaschia claudopus]